MRKVIFISCFFKAYQLINFYNMNKLTTWSEGVHYCKKKIWRRLSPSSIDEIIDKISITKVVNTLWFHINWKNNSILCPFHNEMTASCNIVEDHWKYYCKWCGASWNIIHFVQDCLDKDFIQSAIWLQKKFLPDYKLTFINIYKELSWDEVMDQQQVDMYWEQLTESQLNDQIIEENWIIDEYIAFCKTQQGKILDVQFYEQYWWDFENDLTQDYEKIEKQYSNIYGKTEEYIQYEEKKSQERAKNIENISRSLQIVLRSQEKREKIYRESSYWVNGIDKIPPNSCGKCIITYDRKSKKFDFYFSEKMIDLPSGIKNLNDLLVIMEDGRKIWCLWSWFHREIDFKEWKVIGGWTYYMWDWVIVVSGRSWDFWWMDKKVIEWCFNETDIKVVFWSGYQFSEIKLTI